MNKNYSLDQLSDIAEAILKNSKHKTVLFYGDMGVGKTTLIKEIISQLGVNETVSSPTFSLVNEYLTDKNESVYHFDFYRINSEEEAMDIGFEEYIYSDSWCFIEWPEKVENLVPLKTVKIFISTDMSDRRTIELQNHE